MAKKSVKKKVTKKKSIRRSAYTQPSRCGARVQDPKLRNEGAKKKNIVVKNLAIFVILFVASFLLYNVSTQEIYINLFFILSFIFGFVSIAFLIVYLVFFFRKVMK
ncbi:MAG: hypothetical protein V1788_00600 [Nanoarchaeota archaeon]